MWKLFYSLSFRVIASALLAAIIVVISLVTFYSSRMTDLLSDSLNETTQLVLQVQGDALVQFVADYETDLAEEVLTNLVLNPLIQATQVLDTEGEIILATGEWLADADLALSAEKKLETSDGEQVGLFRLQVNKSELITAQKNNIYTGLLAATFTIVALFVVLFFSMRQITRPLREEIDIMHKLSEGQLDLTIPHTNRQNEIGEIARALDVFKEGLTTTERLRREREIAQQKAEEEKRALQERMASDFEQSVGQIVKQVSSSASNMEQSAQDMLETAKSTVNEASAVLTASSEASGNIQTVATASEQLAASIQEVNNQVQSSNQIAGQAVVEAEATNKEVEGLAESASKIGEIVAMISDIADQTNLLALNATIEAARAGEAGKGFAVVASEVKSLATQTAKATEEIGGQVGEIQKATESAVGAIKGIQKTIESIKDYSTSVASAIEEQRSATGEIAKNVDQAAVSSSEITLNINKVTDLSKHTDQESTGIVENSSSMSDQISVLNQEVRKFVAQVRGERAE